MDSGTVRIVTTGLGNMSMCASCHQGSGVTGLNRFAASGMMNTTGAMTAISTGETTDVTTKETIAGTDVTIAGRCRQGNLVEDMHKAGLLQVRLCYLKYGI
ncbi:hypothetical protein NY406_04470 [Chlorobaculum sp. MV4-Y]|uniref:hypothetical protein n=1 Tax=Chlorobaculum sp. MV4-Y TaxID=2976335 RepID=UPI0021AFFE7B|nr:hypothetical protein [Chlorobaculum sp. MV4-Y]UWX58523.1 hypothetical protein NY406_04470 [Chlorobaculum sp. MV4-Y]